MAKATNTYTQIDQTVPLGRQSVNYSEHGKLNGHTVRVLIKSDSYAFQSYARIEALDQAELKWNVIASIPYSNMATEIGMCYNSTIVTRSTDQLSAKAPEAFAKDAAKLKALCLKLVS